VIAAVAAATSAAELAAPAVTAPAAAPASPAEAAPPAAAFLGRFDGERLLYRHFPSRHVDEVEASKYYL
jgi:hypothetical protein